MDSLRAQRVASLVSRQLHSISQKMGLLACLSHLRRRTTDFEGIKKRLWQPYHLLILTAFKMCEAGMIGQGSAMIGSWHWEVCQAIEAVSPPRHENQPPSYVSGVGSSYHVLEHSHVGKTTQKYRQPSHSNPFIETQET